MHLCFYLKSGLQELPAGDDVGDPSLIQPMSNGGSSQRRVKGCHCNTHIKTFFTHMIKLELEF